MIKNLLIVILIVICLCPLAANAITFDDMLMHHSSDKQPFWGYSYKNIKWVSHTPTEGESEEGEADYRGQIDEGGVDLNGDGKDETIKAIWGSGVSDHSLTIELYKDNKKLATLEPNGIQPNFKVEDMDNDGKLEVVLWGAVSDPNMSQTVDGDNPFEAHSVPHLFRVDVYKLDKEGYSLQESYVSKEKYEPFCEEQPK